MVVIRNTCPDCGGLKETRAIRCRKCYFERRRAKDPLERLLARISISANGCWEWMGAKNDQGYGNFSVSGRLEKAHRYLYERLVGTIPAGYEPDHLSRNHCCVNPDHLEIVTHSENVKRGLPGIKHTHCKRGHPLNEKNLYISPKGIRRCEECNRQRMRRKYWNEHK